MRFWALLAVAWMLPAGSAASAPAPPPTGPAGLAFYQPPSPLPPGKPGHVIWWRPLSGPAALHAAAENALVLYQTTSMNEQDTAVSGTIAIPKGTPPPGGWPVISWAHGTTGNAPQCAPSRTTDEDPEGEAFFDAFLARGYAVVATDYEGQGVPGIHPYFVGNAAARDTIDMVRAAREVYPQIGTTWFVFGHSEGGSATLFTAALAQEWAPELHLSGAIAFAPASFIAGLINGLPKMQSTSDDLPLVLQMIEGLASVDPRIHLDRLMTSRAYGKLPALHQRCIDALSGDRAYTDLAFSDIFKPDADIGILVQDAVRNEDNRLHIDVPLLILQGDSDTVVPPEATDALDKEMCANGSPITLEKIKGRDHLSIVTKSAAEAGAWLDAVAAGTPPAPNCPK